MLPKKRLGSERKCLTCLRARRQECYKYYRIEGLRVMTFWGESLLHYHRQYCFCERKFETISAIKGSLERFLTRLTKVPFLMPLTLPSYCRGSFWQWAEILFLQRSHSVAARFVNDLWHTIVDVLHSLKLEFCRDVGNDPKLTNYS